MPRQHQFAVCLLILVFGSAPASSSITFKGSSKIKGLVKVVAAASSAVIAILRVGTSVANNAGGATSLDLSKPMVISDSGSFMLAVITARTTGTTITPPSGWTQVPTLTHGTGGIRQAVYYKVAGGSEPGSYSFGLSSTVKASGIIVTYSGVDTSNPFVDYGGTATGASTSITAPSVTVGAGAENSRLVTFFGIAHDPAITVPQGAYYSIADAASTGGGSNSRTKTVVSAELVASSGATGAKVATSGNSGDNVGHTVVLRRSSSQPSDPCPGKSIGQACPGGAIYAGIFRADQFMILPGNCNGQTSNPTCDGGTDTTAIDRQWRGTNGTDVDITSVENIALQASPSMQIGNVGTHFMINDASIDTDSAAHYCGDMVYGGYGDWYLPSKSELAYIYCKANVSGGAHSSSYPQENPDCASYGGKTSEIPGFIDYGYWPSTELSSTNVWYQNTDSGVQLSIVAKSDFMRVRCIRRY